MSEFSNLKTARKSRETQISWVQVSASLPTPNPTTISGSSREQIATQRGESTHDALSTEIKPVMLEEHSSRSSNERSPGPVLTSSPYTVGGLYSSLPDSTEIRSSDDSERGRGIWSKYNRKPGDVLISLKPHTAALSQHYLESFCSNCLGTGTSLRRCTGCKIVFYCDSRCQNGDWAMHKLECTALQRWSSSVDASSPGSSTNSMPSVPSDALRCLGRILWKRQKSGAQSAWSREMEGMQSHRSSLQKATDTHYSKLHTQLAHAVVLYLGLSSPQELAEFGLQSAGDLVDLVSRFTTNTFTISTPSLTPIGACVSPPIALINHSCDPNAVVVFPRAIQSNDSEPLMQVIALKYIAADEEILTSYVDTTLPQLHRRRSLLQTYHFTCYCTLCSKPSESVDPREAIYCPRKCGGVCQIPTEEDPLTRCSKCKSPIRDTDAVLDAVRVGQEGLVKAEKLQSSDPQRSLRLTTNLIPILISAGLLPSAHPLLALSRLNTSLLIDALSLSSSGVEEISSPQIAVAEGQYLAQESPSYAQEKLDEVIRAATRSSAGLEQLLTYGHPVRGVALAELGKLLAVDEPAPAHVEAKGSNRSISTPPSVSPSEFIQQPSAPYPPSGPARLKLAYQTLVRANNELKIGFGAGKNEGGETGRTVRQLAVEVEKELGVWKTGLKNVQDNELLPKPFGSRADGR